MIDLNRELVTKEDLFTFIEDVDIYRFYMNSEINLDGAISSPLRKDKKPSFGFFFGDNEELCFKDFGLGIGGDSIKFVQLKFGLNYFEALSKIVVDFDLEDHFIIKNIHKTKKNYDPNKYESKTNLLNKANNFILSKKARPWKLHDYVYWEKYGVDADTLEKYNVQPISYIFLNGKPIAADKYAYCFIEWKDGIETYKIYQPFNKDFKWINGHNESVWQGWEQLPKKGETLIITKSLKDLMAIDNVLNIPATSLQSESIIPKIHIVNQLKDRFNFIYLLYDNDYDKETNWGRLHGIKLADKFNLCRIEINEKFKSKDFSDLINNKGREEAKNIWESNIALPF